MSLYSDPPPLGEFRQDKPTLLVCWWITIFSAVIILIRISGRFVRSETLFTEDRIAALALLPLFARMGCVHVILLYGTNNADFSIHNLSQQQIEQKEIASRLVLLSRVFYSATLWVFKAAILEFFKRLTGVSWERSYEIALTFIRGVLAATFLAVVISDLAECQPFEHYWQVVPDPGGQCRQGYAHLLTMAVCNVGTDLLLIIFPIPIIVHSAMTLKRKVQLISLFSLSLAVVGATIYRVPHVLEAHGNQQTRSLLASIEILFATAASNSLVLGTFVRDRGTKKRRFKYGSFMDSIERSSGSRSRRPTVVRHWGSDEDLVRELGLGVQPDLRDMPESPSGVSSPPPFFQPAPLARDMEGWQFPSSSGPRGGHGQGRDARRMSGDMRSDSSLLNSRDHLYSSPSNSTATPRKVSFYDVGGLLLGSGGNDEGDDRTITTRRDSYLSGIDPLTSPRAGSFTSTGPGPAASAASGSGSASHGSSVPAAALNASSSGHRRGSTALLQDLGGLFGSLGGVSAGISSNSNGGGGGSGRHSKPKSPIRNNSISGYQSATSGTELETIPQEPRFESSYPEDDEDRRRRRSLVLNDPGGLLSTPPQEHSRMT